MKLTVIQEIPKFVKFPISWILTIAGTVLWCSVPSFHSLVAIVVVRNGIGCVQIGGATYIIQDPLLVGVARSPCGVLSRHPTGVALVPPLSSQVPAGEQGTVSVPYGPLLAPLRRVLSPAPGLPSPLPGHPPATAGSQYDCRWPSVLVITFQRW